MPSPRVLGGMGEFAAVKELIKDVPGWLSDEEGEALYELAKECTGRGVIVEIGSWRGKSTICLGLGSRAGQDVRIFAVDPHADYRHGEFKENVERAGIAGLVTPLKGLSRDVVEEFDEPIELLFVDGSHEEEDVRHDFETWVPKVVDRGTVAFHDTTWHPGVRKVVAEKIFASRQFRDVRFVIGSTTVASKIAKNTLYDRLHARRVQATKAVFVAGVGLAQDAGDPNTIYACKHPSGGWLRQVTGPGKCRRRERPVNWNIAGEKGEKGDPGPTGPAGAKGDKGDKGDPGTVVTGLGTLRGVPCVAPDDAAGEIEVTVAANGDVALTCVAAPDEPPPPPPPPPAESASLVINEVDYDQVGTDANGFVEIKNAGGSAIDLANVDLVAVNGGDSAAYDRVALTGSLAPGGHLDVAIELQNGAPDGLALLGGTT